MDINREMEMMLAENDIDLKPKKGKKILSQYLDDQKTLNQKILNIKIVVKLTVPE